MDGINIKRVKVFLKKKNEFPLNACSSVAALSTSEMKNVILYFLLILQPFHNALA